MEFMMDPKVGDIQIYNGEEYVVTYVSPIATEFKGEDTKTFFNSFQVGLKKKSNQISNIDQLKNIINEYNQLCLSIVNAFWNAKKNLMFARKLRDHSIEVDFYEITFDQCMNNIKRFRDEAKNLRKRLIEIRQILNSLIE